MSWTSTLDVPKNYEAAKTYFEGRRDKYMGSRPLKGSANTRVWERPMARGEVAYAIRLYQTDIITYFPDGTVEMHPWDSPTTNDRRSNAAKPLVQSASAVLGAHKGKRVHCTARWAHCSASWPAELWGIGLPADKPLTLDSNGQPVGWMNSTETIWVPVPEEHKRRKALMRWARRTFTPYLDAMEKLGGVSYIAWSFTAHTLKTVRDEIENLPLDSDERAQAMARFCNTYASEVAVSTSWSRDGFSEKISSMAPSKCVGESPMWDTKEVLTSQLKEELNA